MASLLKSFESGADSNSPIGDLAGDEYDLAQSFALDQTSTVERVDLYLRKVNTISDAITVTIETNAAGPIPSGTLANASATQTITPSNTSYDWIAVTFPATFQLVGGTKYWIKCVIGNQSTNNRYEWSRNSLGNGYPDYGQSVSTNGGAFAAEDANADCYFRVYGSKGGLLAFT